MPDRFEFTWEPRYRHLAWPFGIRPGNAWVEVDDEAFVARFGPWGLRTPLANIAEVAITGPYRLYRTGGPARLGVTDAGLTFASNGDRGVLLTFREKVRSRGPVGFLTHPELTVTVADVDGLAARLGGGRRRADP